MRNDVLRGNPYIVRVYDVIDRNSKPPKLAPPREVARCSTEGGGRKQAKGHTHGCLMDGVKNVVEVVGPDGFIERWIRKGEWTVGPRGGDGRVRLKRFTGAFEVVEPEPAEAEANAS